MMGCGIRKIREHEGKRTGVDSKGEAIVPGTNIQDLPDECLIKILRNLGPVNFWREEPDQGIDVEAIRNPLQCALVCKHWRALADLGVESLCLSQRVDVPHVLKAFARWRCLKRLDLGTCWIVFQSSKDVKDVLQAASFILPVLQNLCFEYECKSVHHCDNLPDICTQAYSLSHLTSLELKCRELPPLNARSSQILHTLELFDFTGTELQNSLALFTGLKRLFLNRPFYLELLPTSITQLSLLTRLDLVMVHLRELPDSIGHLTSLAYLRFSSYKCQRWPQSLWDLHALRTLILYQRNYFAAPTDLHHLTRLKDLRVAKLEHFQGLPENVSDLSHLKELELCRDGNSLSELPSSLVDATNLQILRLCRCYSLLRLPDDIGAMASLRELELYLCGEHITSLPETISRLDKLKIAKLYGLPSLSTLPEGLGKCSSLTVLDIDSCDSLHSLPQGLGQLSLLSISRCPGLLSLPPRLGPLTLQITQCTSLGSMPQTLGSRHLYIYHCPSLQQFPESSGQQAPALEKMELRDLPWVSLPSSFGSFKSLKSLHVTDCTSLAGLPESFSELTALEELQLRRCPSLASLPESLGSLCSLTSLVLDRCPVRELPESAGQLTSLETLQFICCRLVSLPQSLGALCNLRELVLSQGGHITQVPDSIQDLGGAVFRIVTGQEYDD